MWCIKRTKETHKEINDWFNKITNSNVFTANTDYFVGARTWAYLHYPAINNKTVHLGIQRGYREIDIEEFRIITNPRKHKPTSFEQRREKFIRKNNHVSN